MEKNIIVKTISTKAHEDADAVVTELTLDFTGLTPEDIQEIAAQAAVIKWQGSARRAKCAIPTRATYKVPRPGTRATVDPFEAILRIAGGDPEKAIAMLRERQAQRA